MLYVTVKDVLPSRATEMFTMKTYRILICALVAAIAALVSVLPFPASAAREVTISVRGLSGDALRNVEKALSLPPGIVEEKGTINRPWLDYFVKQIPAKAREALEPFGYYKSEVAVTEAPGEGTLRIDVEVSPGTPVSVDSVDVRVVGPGASEKILSGLVRAFPLKKGDVLRQDMYEKAREQLRNSALDLGYLGADFSAHTISVSLARNAAEIELVLETGPQYRFGAVSFLGTPSYPDPFLRRYLAFKKGDVFSTKKIGETQLNLRNADRFKDIAIEADRSRAEDHLIPVDIKLAPSPAKRLRAGVGYTTDTGPRLTLQYKDVNVLGRGHEFNTEITIADQLQAYAANYIIPDARDVKSQTVFSFKLQREDVTTYTTNALTVQAEKARSLEKGTLASVFLAALKENSTAGDETTNTFSLYPGARFSRQAYDDLKRPTKGYHVQAEVRGTHQALGSYTGFLQSIFEGGYLLPLPGRFSVYSRFKAAGTLQNRSAEDMPIPLRFFAGGDRSVRGYSYQSLGPKDDNGNVVGGKNLFVGSVQVERAIGTIFGILAFYDTGNAFNNFSQMDLAQGAGVGVRCYTPVGPIEIDLARQIGENNPSYRVHLSIGFGL